MDMMTVLSFLGVAILLYLAWQSFRSKSSGINLNGNQSVEIKSLYKKGIIMSALNPKVSLFFLALLPQFVNTSSGRVALQMFTAIAFFADKVRAFLIKDPRLSRKINIVQGSIFTLIGLKIAFSEK